VRVSSTQVRSLLAYWFIVNSFGTAITKVFSACMTGLLVASHTRCAGAVPSTMVVQSCARSVALEGCSTRDPPPLVITSPKRRHVHTFVHRLCTSAGAGSHSGPNCPEMRDFNG